MTHPSPASTTQPRALACPRCGTAFTCDLSGRCWCADEAARLPMPTEGEDCLCPNCLRTEAARREAGQP
jgi:hypothetical protein